MICPYCHKQKHVVKYGTYADVQRYWCKTCQRKFRDPDFAQGQWYSKDIISQVMTFYFNGMSYRNVSHTLQDLHDFYTPKMTLWRWVVHYSNLVNVYVASLTPNVGDEWVADETVIKVRGETWWYWDLIDYDTRYLIATHFSKTRGIMKATKLFSMAQRRVEKSPLVIRTDKLKDYEKGISNVFGAEVERLQSRGFGSDTHTNLIERFHGIIKQRTKVMRHFKKPDSAAIVLNGFIVDYNFLKEHSHLHNTPPAVVAEIGEGIRNWGDLIEKARGIDPFAPEGVEEEEFDDGRAAERVSAYANGRIARNPPHSEKFASILADSIDEEDWR